MLYYQKHRGRIAPEKLRRYRLALAAGLMLAALMALNAQFRRVAEDAASVMAQNEFSRSAAEAILMMTEDGVSFDVVSVGTGENGEVVSVAADTGRLNRLKSELTGKFLALLEQRESDNVEISLGTLTGSELLAGRGPKLRLRMELCGGVNAEITSDFFEAGINQTLHRVCCVLSADYYIILPGYRFRKTLTTTVPMAESVIVGTVPEAFTYVVGDQSDTIGRIFDYGAEPAP